MKNKKPSFSLKELNKVQILKSSNLLNKLAPLTIDQILLPSYIQSKKGQTMKKEKDTISKLDGMVSVDKMTRLVNELKIVLQPYTIYGKGGALDRELTGKTLEDSERETKIDLYYYRKYGRR